ncbi:MAG: mycofactocin biosynthesis chaperone MftB [Rhodospirillales bacterium]
MNLTQRYRLADRVAIRPERFGGLVYNYGNRRLFFLHSHDLTEFVSGMTGTEPLADAIARFRARRGLPPSDEAFLEPLAALERIGLIVATDNEKTDP